MNFDLNRMADFYNDKSVPVKKKKGAKFNKDFKMDVNSFFGDWDGDGVINGVDCQPRNKYEQDVYTDFRKMAGSAVKTVGTVAANISKPYVHLATNPVGAVQQAGKGLNTLITNPSQFSQNVVRGLTNAPTKTVVYKPTPLKPAYAPYRPVEQTRLQAIVGRAPPRPQFTQIKKIPYRASNTISSPLMPKGLKEKFRKDPGTYIQPTRPVGWNDGPPALNPGYKPDYKNVFIPEKAIRDQNSISSVGQGYAVNPYYKPINRYTAKEIVDKKMLTMPQGNVWQRTPGKIEAPKLSPGYKPNYISKTISRKALADPDQRFGRGAQVVNPYYILKNKNETIKSYSVNDTSQEGLRVNQIRQAQEGRAHAVAKQIEKDPTYRPSVNPRPESELVYDINTNTYTTSTGFKYLRK